jgi:DNA-binding response OmpR family regulator
MPQAKILIVEDEKDVQELIRYNLDRAGYETDTAVTGKLALEKTLEFKPDLILLDLMLPEMDGLQVCDNLKSNAETAGIPVIMLTAKSTAEDVIRGFEMDADDYITKPFSPRNLLARIQTVLHQKTTNTQ